MKRKSKNKSIFSPLLLFAISATVAASVKATRKQHGDSKPKIIWTPEELIQFRAVADEDEWAAAWRLTLPGLRRSEVLGMQWTAVDLPIGEVKVEAGRVLLDKARLATDDPKSSASHRTRARRGDASRHGRIALFP